MTQEEQFQAVYNGIAAVMVEISTIISRLDTIDGTITTGRRIRLQQYNSIIAEVNARATAAHNELEQIHTRLTLLEALAHQHDDADPPN